MSAFLSSLPSALSDLVEVQSGSVVSKEILKTPNGTISVFAFDKDQGLSEHTAPFDVLVYLISGVAEITISGHTHLVKEGEIIKMPAQEPHALHAREQFKMLLILLRR